MNNLPKNFVIQLGSLITLYISIAAFITLIFSTVNIAIPDPAAVSWAYDNNQSALRTSLSLLVVFFPTYIFLTHRVNQIRRTEKSTYATLTKWLIYISLLIGGLIMLIDLVFVVNTFLEGELTTRFAIKAAALLGVIAVTFNYYLLDAKDYWQKCMQGSAVYGAVMSALVIGMMAASLYHLETPSEVREQKIDDTQVQDLTEMYWRIETHYATNGTLPNSIDTLYEEEELPTAPEGRSEYMYKITSPDTFELCAEFATEDYNEASRIALTPDSKNYNWNHGAGSWCFEREVTYTEKIAE